MTNITVREALRDGIAEEMRKDSDIFIIGEEVAEYQGAYKVTQGLLQEFGAKRVIDSPISEHGFTGLAIGAAFAGLKPIVEFMTFNFAMQAIDQIINSAAKTLYMSEGGIKCPIVFRGPNGAAARVAAQHSQCYASWYSHIPGLKVVAPYSATDAKYLLKAAINDPNPVIFLENEILYNKNFELEDHLADEIQLGKAHIKRKGEDVTLISYSICVEKCLEAAKILADKNIDCEVIDLRTIKPLDSETILNSVRKTNRIVIVQEGWDFSGVAASISCLISDHLFDYLDAPIKRVTGKDVPLPYAKNLEELALPQIKDIISSVESIIYKKN